VFLSLPQNLTEAEVQISTEQSNIFSFICEVGPTFFILEQARLIILRVIQQCCFNCYIALTSVER
jgi:hypothetical protein